MFLKYGFNKMTVNEIYLFATLSRLPIKIFKDICCISYSGSSIYADKTLKYNRITIF